MIPVSDPGHVALRAFRSNASGMDHELDWLLQEHEGLDEQLPQLRDALAARPPALAAIRAQLEMLAAELPIHLEAEELVVFPWLVERLPAAGPSVELLLREHVQLLTMLSSLQLLAAGEVVVSEEELRRVGQGFVETLAVHSRMERELLERALETRIPA